MEKEVMGDVLDIIQEIVKAKSFQSERLDELVRQLQSKRGTPGLPTTPLFFGIAKGIEKITEDSFLCTQAGRTTPENVGTGESA